MSTLRNKPLAILVRPVDIAACLTLDTNSARSSLKTHQVKFVPACVRLYLACDLVGLLMNSVSAITESTDSGSTSVKKEKEKKNRKKDKENGSGSGEAGNHDNFDAPEAVVGFIRCPDIDRFIITIARVYLESSF